MSFEVFFYWLRFGFWTTFLRFINGFGEFSLVFNDPVQCRSKSHSRNRTIPVYWILSTATLTPLSYWTSKRECLPFVRQFRWKNFGQMVLVFCLAQKRGTGLSCTIYKIPINFSLSLKMKPGAVGRVGKNGKNVIPRNVVLVFRKISTGMNRSIWTLPGISEFSIQMVISQAFDTVDHTLGLSKLDCYGITGPEGDRFRSYPSKLNWARKVCSFSVLFGCLTKWEPNLAITSISLIYSLTWLSRGLNRLTCVTRQIRGDSKLRD